MRRAALVVAAIAALWLGALTFGPAMLGLGTVTVEPDDAASTGYDAGTLLLTRHLPSGELQAGDVVVPRAGAPLEHVVSDAPGTVTLAPADGSGTPSTLVEVEHPSLEVVVGQLPFAALPDSGPAGVALLVLGAVVLTAMLALLLAATGLVGRPAATAPVEVRTGPPSVLPSSTRVNDERAPFPSKVTAR